MKTVIIYFLLFGLFISGCSFNVQMVTPAPVEADQATPTRQLATPIMITPLVNSTEVTPPPALPANTFFNHAFFTLEAVNGNGQWTFPAGTKQIFASWNYQNMQAGMIVKREWFLNGQPWLTREEPWDFAKYGANGTLHDISIYDLEIGLPSGAYQLTLSVNNIPQPIGNALNGSFRYWTSFEILPSQIVPEVYAYDTQTSAAVLDGKTLIMRDASKRPSVLFNGREIQSVAWLPDNQHVLFVDRDRSNQQGTTTIGIRDDLWLVDTQSNAYNLLYQSPTMLGGKIGFIPSPDSKLIASVAGSGYGDACLVDSHLIFFQLSDDFQSASVIQQGQFAGLPAIQNGSVYPAEPGTWKNNTQYFTKLNATCTTQPNQGMYSLDISTLKAANVSTAVTTPVMGDLGWGTIHGKITDADSGLPIVGAIVTCEHHSYTSPYPCSGTVVTTTDGSYLFPVVFFHDTDAIKLTVLAPGYQPKEVTFNAFTTPDLQADISLNYPP